MGAIFHRQNPKIYESHHHDDYFLTDFFKTVYGTVKRFKVSEGWVWSQAWRG